MRIEAEILRDSILAVSGSLNRQMYGPGVRPPIPPEATLTRSRDKWPKDAVDGRTVVFNAPAGAQAPVGFALSEEPEGGVPQPGNRIYHVGMIARAQ